MLTELEKSYKTAVDHRLFNFSSFPFVKMLVLRVDISFDESLLSVERMNVIASQISKMSQLQSLILLEVDAEFVGIIANHEEVNKGTKCLYVEQQQTGRGALDRFLSSITSFKHLQFLKVFMMENQGLVGLDMAPIIEMCSNLRGLDFYDCDLSIELAILQAIGHQLHYLVFHGDFPIPALKGQNFVNLRQLRQGLSCPDDSFRFILKTAVNLEKVEIRTDGDPALISEVLARCERLKYLEIGCGDAYDKMEDILDIMKLFFDKNKDVLQETLKIRIKSSLLACTLQQTKNIPRLQGIINSLSANSVDQWMIILDLLSIRGKNIKTFYNEVQRKLNWNKDVCRTVQIGNLIVMTNPNCTINGIGESWLM